MQFSNNGRNKIKPQPSTIQYLDGMSVLAFKDLLLQNPGHVVIKFGAEWCGPCKKIESLVDQWFSAMPESVSTHIVDIDESFELYALLKTKRQINGIPAILCYKQGNTDIIPDYGVAGSDVNQIGIFFQRVLSEAK
jgi:thiol-disulfide isomerase/thioredoxin